MLVDGTDSTPFQRREKDKAIRFLSSVQFDAIQGNHLQHVIYALYPYGLEHYYYAHSNDIC